MNSQIEHREVAAEILGRPLRRDELVHHVNGIRGDNRRDNLWIVSSEEHVRLHNAVDLNIGALTPIAMSFACGCKTWLATAAVRLRERQALWSPCALHAVFAVDTAPPFGCTRTMV